MGPSTGTSESTGIPQEKIDELIRENSEHDCGNAGGVCVRIVAVADLPTRFGSFQVVAFDSPSDGKEHAAVIRGNVLGRDRIPVRLHSECLTSEAFGSMRCDCREQLELALSEIAHREFGMVLYLRQEGRGIGFANKIRAYHLQDSGLDTIEANEALGFRGDERDYDVAAHMLGSLGVKSILLMSNNPDKMSDLKFHGVKVEGRIPIVVPPNPHNRRYLETKRLKAGHLLDTSGSPGLTEQLDAIEPTPEER